MNKKKINFVLAIGIILTAFFVTIAIVSVFYTPCDPYDMSFKEKFLELTILVATFFQG